MSNNNSLKYQLFAIDLDGTLLTKSKKITKKDKLALKKYANSGGEIFITTGKCLDSTLPYIREIENSIGKPLKYCSCLSGNVIYDIQERKVIYSNYISDDITFKIYRIAKRLHMTFVPYIKSRNGNKKVFIYKYKKYEPMEAFKINVFSGLLGFWNMNKLHEELLKIQGIEILTTHNLFYEIVKKDSNKGSSLKYITDKLSIDMSRVACAGDSYNDLPMFKVSGTSFLVRDQDHRFKKHIDHLITQKRNKIADIINNYFFVKD